MADMNQAGGKQFGAPDYSDAIPPKPDRQGGMAQPNYTTPSTFESGQAPDARSPIESDWQGLVNTNGLNGGPVDGYRPAPVGGTYNPGQGKSPASPGVERSPASVRGDY